MKPLRILLANNTLSLLAGSETWTLTLARQLKAMGHFVACFSPDLGFIARKLEDEGIFSYNNIVTDGIKPFSVVLEESHKHEYDVIIANHNHIVAYLREQFPKTPIISTIHGIIHFLSDDKTPAPEHPALDSGVNQFIAVSEEVQDKLLADYGLDSIVIRNFFDVERLGNLRPANETPKQFLINSNYMDRDDEEFKVIKEVADHFGAKVAAIGQNFAQALDTTRAIEDSDVIFGMGRSVLEGVAAGRLGIVHGRWGTGGVVCESNIDDLKRFNFSGRNAETKEPANAQELIKMIEKFYTPSNLEWGKKYVAKNHNVAFAAESFIRIARELTGDAYSRPASPKLSAVGADVKPYRRAND